MTTLESHASGLVIRHEAIEEQRVPSPEIAIAGMRRRSTTASGESGRDISIADALLSAVRQLFEEVVDDLSRLGGLSVDDSTADTEQSAEQAKKKHGEWCGDTKW
jgi:hypothetical protein